MDERKRNQIEPLDNGIFGTGRTEPPKNYGSLIAALLILVIFLSGIVCALGILNIRLSRQLQAEEQYDPLSISFTDTNAGSPNHTGAADSGSKTNVDAQLNIDLSPIPENNPEKSTEALSWSAIYEKNIPSVVSITSTHSGGSTSGTGVILSSDGYIVTNAHVVENAAEIVVLLSDDRMFHAQLIGADVISDLAVLYIDASDLIPAEFGDSALLHVGDSVVAIGDPLGVEFRGTMTDGIISAINRNVTIEGRTMTLIQTNAALNTGNSGGPLINQHGQVIGINTMKISAYTGSDVVEGLGFAIPSATVKDVVDQLIRYGYVAGRPTLGLESEEISTFYQNYYRLPAGMFVTEVEDNSQAQEAGIQPGDILIRVGDTPVTDEDILDQVLYAHEIGDTVTVVIWREGTEQALALILEEEH